MLRRSACRPTARPRRHTTQPCGAPTARPPTCHQLHGCIRQQPSGLAIWPLQNGAPRRVGRCGGDSSQAQGGAVGQGHVAVVPQQPGRHVPSGCRDADRAGASSYELPTARPVGLQAVAANNQLAACERRCPDEQNNSIPTSFSPASIHSALGISPPQRLSSHAPPSSHCPGRRPAAAAAATATNCSRLVAAERSRRERDSPPYMR